MDLILRTATLNLFQNRSGYLCIH